MPLSELLRMARVIILLGLVLTIGGGAMRVEPKGEISPEDLKLLERVTFGVGDLKREAVDPTYFKMIYTRVVFLKVKKDLGEYEGEGTCIGVMVDAQHLLTVGHCLFRATHIVAYRFRNERLRIKDMIHSEALNWIEHPKSNYGLTDRRVPFTTGNIAERTDLAFVSLKRAFLEDRSKKIVGTPDFIDFLPDDYRLEAMGIGGSGSRLDSKYLPERSTINLQMVGPKHSKLLQDSIGLRVSRFKTIRRFSPAGVAYEGMLDQSDGDHYVCPGDSGNPIFVDANDYGKDFKERRFYLIGLQSSSPTFEWAYVPKNQKDVEAEAKRLGKPKVPVCGPAGWFVRIGKAEREWVNANWDAMMLPRDANGTVAKQAPPPDVKVETPPEEKAEIKPETCSLTTKNGHQCIQACDTENDSWANLACTNICSAAIRVDYCAAVPGQSVECDRSSYVRPNSRSTIDFSFLGTKFTDIKPKCDD